MNMNALLEQVKLQKTEGNKMFAQQEILRGVNGNLERHEQKPNAWYNFIIPKQLQLPFHPVDLQDEYFNAKNPFIVKGLVDEVVVSLKQAMRENADLHKLYATLGGLTTDTYDISEDKYTEQDMDIFNQYCFPYQVSLPTIKFMTKEAGQYGTTRLSPFTVNENGECSDPATLAWQIREFETAVIEQKLAEYMLDKDKSKLSDDQKKIIKAKRQDNKMGWPKRTGYLMYLELPMDEATESVTADALKVKPEDALHYMKFNGDEMKKLLKKRGKKKDVYPNFWDVQVAYGDGKPSGDETPEIALYKSREYELIDPKAEADEDASSIFKKIPDYKEKVNKFFQENVEYNFESLAKKFIWDFKPAADNYIQELWHERMKELMEYVTPKIYNRFLTVIELCNYEVATELRNLSKDGKLSIDFSERAGKMITVKGNEVIIDGDVVEKGDADELDGDDEVIEEGPGLEALARG